MWRVTISILLGLALKACCDQSAEQAYRPFRFEPLAPLTGPGLGYQAFGPGKEGVILYTAALLPNPFREPQQCVLSTQASHVWLCDPEHLLSAEEEAVVQAKLLKLRDTRAHVCADGQSHPFQLAVAVVPDIYVGESRTAQDAADTMARELLLSWGVGSRPCHDGLLFLFVKNKSVAAAVGREKAEEEFLTPAFLHLLRAHANLTYLATGSVAAALYRGIELIEGRLPPAERGLGWLPTLLILLAVAYLASVGVVYYFLSYALTKRFEFEEE